jgi:hypothetical protein
VLSGGFDFPIFESGGNQFSARIAFTHSPEFAEFIRKRSQSLAGLDEIVVLRALWAQDSISLRNLATVMQRGLESARQILTEMRRRLLVESPAPDTFRLAANVRSDIENVFLSNQLTLFST